MSEVVFTMGLPGAGKSHVVENILGLSKTHCVIDPDIIKAQHPDYDPRNPDSLHVWSKEVAEGMFRAALSQGNGRYVVDGTGTNAEKMIRRIREAKAAGFETRLVYVRVSLATSLRRNAERERTVPEHVVRAKARDIAVSFEIVSREADRVETIDNED